MDKKITNFAINYDENTKEQFENCCSNDFVVSASLMPDAHSGYVAPIGSVIITKGVIIPSWVGYDIGCGMIACKIEGGEFYDAIFEKRDEIYERVIEKIPMGVGKIGKHGDVSDEIRNRFKELYKIYQDKIETKEINRFLKTQAMAHLGSLGSGNHFIELGFSKDKSMWVVIHSGSRGVGKTIATHYMKQASGSKRGFERTATFDLDSKEGKEYKAALDFSLEFALLNRLEIAKRVEIVLREVLENKNLCLDLWTNKNHNHAIVMDDNLVVHRKGATPAEKGERGVIPGNMKDGSFLVEGLGNEDYLYSSSHGAGRVLSRKKAKSDITIDELREDMEGIKSRVDTDVLDEAPMAYKNIYDVMEAQKNSVCIVEHIKPVVNWKG